MKEYKLLKYYPSLPTEWKTDTPVVVVLGFNEYRLHPSLNGILRFAIVDKKEVEDNSEYWLEIKPKEPLLITEDRVALYEGDIYYVPQRRNNSRLTGSVLKFEVTRDIYPDPSLRFGKKENAEIHANKYKNYLYNDGSGIRKGSKFYIYDDKYHKILYGEFGHFTDKKYDGNRYKTQKEVEDLIELNKAQYSLKDIIRVVNKLTFNCLHSKDDILKLLAEKETVKIEL